MLQRSPAQPCPERRTAQGFSSNDDPSAAGGADPGSGSQARRSFRLLVVAFTIYPIEFGLEDRLLRGDRVQVPLVLRALAFVLEGA